MVTVQFGTDSSFLILISLVAEGIETWTSADTSPASYSVYGGSYDEGDGTSHIPENLKTLSGLWHSASAHGPRGVSVTFENEVTIKRFSGPYMNFSTSKLNLIVRLSNTSQKSQARLLWHE